MTWFATLILASSLIAEPSPPPVPKLADVTWLAGSWRGQMSGGQIEEVWTRSKAAS